VISRIGVVGAGLLGSGIAEACVRAGLDVIVAEANLATAETGWKRIGSCLDRACRDGRLTLVDRMAAEQRLLVTDDFGRLSDREIVVEAVTEDEHIKTLMFARLGEIVTNPAAILVSSTSSVPIIKLGMATRRPQQVIGLRFVNRAPLSDLAELVPSLLTSAATRQRAEEFAIRVLGKPAVPSQDQADLTGTALLVPYLLLAIRMVESGFASAEDIDSGMVRGCAHPMGPLQLADLIGLDTMKSIAESLYAEFKEPFYSPPPLLARMVDGGRLGRKSGRGFHTYAAGAAGTCHGANDQERPG
jgi:3-hydroxybutyryl-CoA dehydrogenase